MEHPGPDDIVRAIQRDEWEQSSRLGEGRQISEVRDQRVAIERREIAGIAELRVLERRQDAVDVLEPG
jgi:hypothetical protein